MFPDADAVRQAMDAGVVGEDGRVKAPHESVWTALGDHPDFASPPISDDPWAAWDAMEGATETIHEPVTEPHGPGDGPEVVPTGALVAADPESLDELPTEAVSVVPSATRTRGRFVIEGPKNAARRAKSTGASAPSSVEIPSSRHAVLDAPSSPNGGLAAEAPTARVAPSNVIAFPSRGGPSTLGPHALAPLHSSALFELPALQVKPKIEPRTGPRWGMMALVAFGSFALVGIVHSWVRHVATQTFTPSVQAKPAAVAVVEPTGVDLAQQVAEPAVEMAAVDELTKLDQALRGRIRTELGTVTQKGDLESSLYVDLSRMNLSGLKVDAVVTAWGGKQRDVPQSAEIQVGFRSRPGELDREFAAVGLIVGRYIQSYELDVPRFEVLLDAGESGVRRWPIDPAQARNYYMRRTELPTFLTNMRSVGGR
ncbi:MAG: hypothetical protein CL927_05130 [Deltaproteobacteria bacterium]|nr:hypothetical protein [Deltaproteobacteria bacterium]HCH66209.1 hypothetical protein [Deltaproteobacteria bacterium]